MKLPGSVTGWVLAGGYVAIALFTVASDRKGGGGGGWISLSGMGTFLVTFPVSFVGEMIGMKPDFRRNLDMAFAIVVCSALAFGLGTLAAKLAKALFASGPPN